jgi:hypothetical protein
MNDDTYLGRVAYEAYRNSSRGVSLVSGQELPNWEDQRDEIQSAWCAAAQAVQRDLGETTEGASEEVKLDDAHREG